MEKLNGSLHSIPKKSVMSGTQIHLCTLRIPVSTIPTVVCKAAGETAKHLVEIPHHGAQQCRLEREIQALYQAVIRRELRVIVTLKAGERVESPGSRFWGVTKNRW